MKKQAIMPVVVLTVICVFIAALVGGVYELTKDKIADNALRKEQASLLEVLPGADLFDEVIEKPDGIPATIKTIYKETNGLGYVFIVVAEKTAYSSGDMTISIGVSNGTVTGAKITSYNESRDIGKNTYPDKFVGKTEANFGDVEVTADVTYSSKAFKSAIGDALACEKILNANETITAIKTTLNSSGTTELPKTDGELAALLAELIPNETIEEKAIPYGADSNFKKMYSVSNGGYVAYIVVPGQYVPVATEALIYVNSEGIVESINLLQWVVGHDIEPGDFAEGFIGTSTDDVNDVEIVAGATGTSNDFKSAAINALTAITDLINSGFPAIDLELAALLGELVPDASFKQRSIPSDADSTLNAIYTASKGGYVAHIIVPGQYVPVATEALVYVNNDCKIENINLLQWIVGHDVGPDGFAEGFIGTNTDDINDVEIVAGATGTSQDFKTATISAFSVITDLINNPDDEPTAPELPKTDEQLASLIAQLVPGTTVKEISIPDDADSNLKKVYTVVGGGCVAYIVVPGQYVPVATEALIYVNSKGIVENINLLQWVVGHGVEPGDFAEGFIGTDIYHIENVELVAGVTGTAKDFKSAVVSSLSAITDLIDAREAALIRLVDEIIPNSGEIKKLDLPEGAPKTLVGLYTDSNNRGTVAHIIVPGQYVPVATEALVYFNQYGEIRGVKMIQWVVGHGVGHDGFEEGFIGASTKDEIGEVELVANATVTAEDFRNAVVDAYPYIPVQAPTIKIIAAAILVVAIAGFVTALIITRRRGACK